jgi:hypothetical protein
MSSVGLAVALLSRALDASSRAQSACSAADERARAMLSTYTQIADDSGRDAPNAARRDVSDAQEALLRVVNQLQQAAAALGEYTRWIAPALGDRDRGVAQPRPSGTELLETPPVKSSVRSRMGRLAADQLDDVTDSATQAADAAGAAKKFGTMPKDPGPAQAVTGQPPSDAPVTRPPDSDGSGGAVEIAIAAAAVVLNWKRFRERMTRMFKAKAGDGNS